MADFGAVADTLREQIRRHYDERGEPIGPSTLETNSGYVERRAEPLLRMLADDGVTSLEGLDVIDLGCGFGALACLFATMGAHVVAIDRKADRVQVGRAVAEAHGLDAEFLTARIQWTARPKGSFDIALLNNSLCYVVPHPQRDRVFGEVRRILRPEGRVIMRNPNRWAPRDQFSGLPLVGLATPERAVWLARRAGRARSFVRLTSPREAARELRAAGFEDVRQLGFDGSRRPDTLKLVTAYHHFIARRPVG